MNQENKTSVTSIVVTVIIVIVIIFFLGNIFSGGGSSSSSSQRKALERAMEKSVTGEEMSPREKSEYDSYKKWEKKYDEQQKWKDYDKKYK